MGPPKFVGVVCFGAKFAFAAPPQIVVDLRNEGSTNKVAVQVCAGLYNRNDALGGGAYTFMNNGDLEWLADIEGITNPTLTSVSDFLAACLAADGPANGYVRYNYTDQQRIVPNIITLAAVLDIVPLEDGHPSCASAEMAFDAVTEFAGFSALEATEYMYENHVDKTTTMAKMNPGIDTSKPFDAPLTGEPNPGLIDFIVKERLFNFFLNWNCVPFTKEHRLLERMVANNPWPKPIAVYGYDNTFALIGNDWFEAETYCTGGHNMGQIASEGVNNVAFFNRKPRITEPLLQNPDPTETYDASTTYITLIAGDGDNVGFIKGSRRDWMKQRISKCLAAPDTCFPLVWTISPQLLHMAPDILHWYYNQSYQTGNDYFILPPSGDLYAYPSAIQNETEREMFVRNTELDTYLFNSSGMVAWEYASTWKHAIEDYFPRYAERGVVRGIFPVNDLFLLPILEFGANEDFKVFGDNVVLFKQYEWRGESQDIAKEYPSCSWNPWCIQSYLSPEKLAAKVNAYPKGTVHNIYLTSDGGGNMDNLFNLVSMFDSHVKVVNHNTIVDMALQIHRSKEAEVLV